MLHSCMVMQDFYRTMEAAQFLKCHPSTIRQAARHGKLTFVLVGSHRLYPRAALEAYQAGRTVPMPETHRFYNLTQAAVVVGISRQALRQAALDGRIACLQYGKYRVCTLKEIHQFMEKRAVA